MDVKSTFVKRVYSEGVYVAQLKGFIDPVRHNVYISCEKLYMDSKKLLEFGMKGYLNICHNKVIIEVE